MKECKFTKEKAEQDSKNQATKQYSINLAKFFGDEIERLAGKSGLPHEASLLTMTRKII